MSEKERSINQIWKAKSGHIMRNSTKSIHTWNLSCMKSRNPKYFEQKQNNLDFKRHFFLRMKYLTKLCPMKLGQNLVKYLFVFWAIVSRKNAFDI